MDEVSEELLEAVDYAMWEVYAHLLGKKHADGIVGYRPKKQECNRVYSESGGQDTHEP